MFRPVLFTELKTYSWKKFSQDLFAGLTVGVVALPLAMAFSIACGFSPARGIYTAVIAGFLISFFGGSRFIPIVSTAAYIVVGGLMYLLWPFAQSGIYALGDLVLKSGYAGTFIYGFIERILIPFGLHHVFYLPFWQTGHRCR